MGMDGRSDGGAIEHAVKQKHAIKTTGHVIALKRHLYGLKTQYEPVVLMSTHRVDSIQYVILV